MKPLPVELFRQSGNGYGAPAVAMQVLVTFIAVCVILYFGRDVLIPVVLAVLLAVLLAPAVRFLHRLGLPKVVAVATMVVTTLASVAVVASVVAFTLTNLAGELPRYEGNLRDKAQNLKAATAGSTTLIRAANVLESLQAELAQDPAPKANTVMAKTDAAKPLPVEIYDTKFGPLQPIVTVVEMMAHPLAQFGIVFLMLTFVLFNREDLRNRLVRLAGTGDMPRTTVALDEAGTRLSHYFITQLVINASTGILIGAALFVLGVPGALLWGILTAILRFVPYIGTFLAAVFPVIIAIAVGDGWTLALVTLATIAVTELVVGHIIEPLFFGRMTGLSPVAVVMAAAFWTALWGPVGLLLSTPLTVGLLVLGRNIEQLEFLQVMLGSGSVLSGEHLFYQRLLAGDPIEAAEQALAYEKSENLPGFLTEVAVPALLLAHKDHSRGVIDRAAATRIATNLATALSEVWDDPGLPDDRDVAVAVAGAPGPLNHAAALAVSALFRLRKIDHVILPDNALTPEFGGAIPKSVNTLVVCHLVSPNRGQNVYVLKRARSRAGERQIVSTAWLSPEDRESLQLPANIASMLPGASVPAEVEVANA